MSIIAKIKQACHIIGIARVSSFAKAFNEINEYIQQQTKISHNLTAPLECVSLIKMPFNPCTHQMRSILE